MWLGERQSVACGHLASNQAAQTRFHVLLTHQGFTHQHRSGASPLHTVEVTAQEQARFTDQQSTLLLEASAKLSGVLRAEDPTMVQDPSEPWDDFFTFDGETSLKIATRTGGSWFVLRTAANGAPVDGRVMLAQITTPGSVSGALNLQVFPVEPEIEQFRVRFEFDGLGRFEGRLIE